MPSYLVACIKHKRRSTAELFTMTKGSWQIRKLRPTFEASPLVSLYNSLDIDVTPFTGFILLSVVSGLRYG
jgi:hypothetical protein